MSSTKFWRRCNPPYSGRWLVTHTTRFQKRPLEGCTLHWGSLRYMIVVDITSEIYTYHTDFQIRLQDSKSLLPTKFTSKKCSLFTEMQENIKKNIFICLFSKRQEIRKQTTTWINKYKKVRVSFSMNCDVKNSQLLILQNTSTGLNDSSWRPIEES